VFRADPMIDRNRGFQIGKARAFVTIRAPKNINRNSTLGCPPEFVLKVGECRLP
jgi:hypothetical protein